jgi:cytochrome P450
MSTALNFLLLMLAMHENVQHRIMREINEVFGELEECKDLISTVDYEKLSALKYVEMNIKESLRLFSPATGIFSIFFLIHPPSVCLFRIL